jgi:hypothetical protein
MPRWYRPARLVGGASVVLSFLGVICAFPFIYGDPGSAAESDKPDPAWFPLLMDICIGLLGVGLLVLLAPTAHRLLARRRW